MYSFDRTSGLVQCSLPPCYLCEHLLWQQMTLENLQKSKDCQSDPSIHILWPTTLQSIPDRNHEQNNHYDAAAMKLLDELFAGNDSETQLEDDDLEDMDHQQKCSRLTHLIGCHMPFSYHIWLWQGLSCGVCHVEDYSGRIQYSQGIS